MTRELEHGNTFERVIELLGKPLADPLLDRLSKDLNAEYEVFRNELVAVCCFPKTGFFIKCIERITPGIFTEIVFHLATPSVESGKVTSYSGNLPGGVKAGDSRNKVAGMLGARYYKGDYRMEPFNVGFMFNEDKIATVTVELLPPV